MKKRRSLSVKLSLIFIGGIVLAIVAGGVTTYLVQDKIIDNYTTSRLKNSVYESCKDIEETLVRTESTVEDSRFVAESFFTTTGQLYDQAYVDDSLASVAGFYGLSAKHYEDVSSYWVILNPAYTHCTETSPEGDGFFMVKNAANEFVAHEVTNIKKYGDDDIEHIGWWNSIKNTQKSIWMDPYYNANIDKNIFSYIQPIFSTNNEFLGAIGIDIDLNWVINEINEVKEYDDSYSILLNKEGKIVYHKDVETFVNGRYVPSDLTMKDIAGIENYSESETGAITYKYGGHRRTSLSVELKNSLRYGISVRTGELRKPVRLVTFLPQLVYVGVALIFVGVVYFLIRYYIKPLHDLNDAIERVEKGDMKFTIKPKREDEIGSLTESFSNMVGALAEKNKMISAMAFLDGLTGVKNKNAHREMVRKLDKEIEEGTAKFAVCMLDVNNLKMINDNVGHEAGDKVIIGCCYALCKGFSHSPVFRIGGDEFVAIINGDDYENRQQIYDKLRKNEIKVRDVEYDFAVGMATFDSTHDHCFNDVFKRADQEMYLNKKEMKSHEQD